MALPPTLAVMNRATTLAAKLQWNSRVGKSQTRTGTGGDADAGWVMAELSWQGPVAGAQCAIAHNPPRVGWWHRRKLRRYLHKNSFVDPLERKFPDENFAHLCPGRMCRHLVCACCGAVCQGGRRHQIPPKRQDRDGSPLWYPGGHGPGQDGF